MEEFVIQTFSVEVRPDPEVENNGNYGNHEGMIWDLDFGRAKRARGKFRFWKEES